MGKKRKKKKRERGYVAWETVKGERHFWLAKSTNTNSIQTCG